jgi:mitochondrial fission protein ELM1
VTETAARRDPLVWVLLADRAGGNGQLLSLAEALGWPFERKAMAYNGCNRLPNLLLGASLTSVRPAASSPLEPPWPDLVIGASRRSVPVARWIRARSGGRTKLVHLLHAMAPLDLFDLVVTTPQYRLPARPNVLHLAAPLNRIPESKLVAAAARWSPQLAPLQRPFVALLVGGNSATHRLGPLEARELGKTASASVVGGGTLLVSTSPRTPPAAADALVAALTGPSFVYRWRPGDANNPYHGFLALADRFIVTADSASQLVEACLTGKPVDVYDLPRRRQPILRSKEWLWPRDDGTGVLDRGIARLVEWGLVKPPRDFAALHRVLRERGLAGSLGGAPAAARRQALDDMERAVTAIRGLFPGLCAGDAH